MTAFGWKNSTWGWIDVVVGVIAVILAIATMRRINEVWFSVMGLTMGIVLIVLGFIRFDMAKREGD